MKKIILFILCVLLMTPKYTLATESDLELLDENDYKKMPNAWHWTALYPPAYAAVGIKNCIRIKKEKQRIREHNEEVLKLKELSYNIEDLTCLELKYKDDNLRREAEKIEYFYIDPTNKVVLGNDKKPVFKVEKFDDATIKFITKTPTYYDGYDILRVYIIDRYTGSLKTGKERFSNNVFTKFNTALTTGLYNIPIGEGTGTVNKVDRVLQKF